MSYMSVDSNFRYVGEYVRTQVEGGRKALEEGVYDRAIELFSAALRARGMNPEIEAEIRCSLSETYEEDTNGQEALDAVSKYESIAERESLPKPLQTLVWLRMGMSYARLSNHPKAITYLNTSLKLAEGLDDAAAIGRSHLALGRSYSKVDEYHIAHDHVDLAVENIRQVGDRRLLALTYLAKGTILLREGKYDEGTEFLESAERLIQDKPFYSVLGEIMLNRAAIYFFQHRSQEAITYQERSIAHYERAGQRRYLVAGLNNLGLYSFFLGEIDRAQSEWERAAKLSDQLGYKIGFAHALDGLAQIDTLRGNYAVAEDRLKTALSILEVLKSKWYELRVRHSLIRLYCDRGDFKTAVAAASHVLGLAEKIGDEYGLQMAKLLLCEAKILNCEFEEAELLADEVDKKLITDGDLLLVGFSRRLRSRILSSHDRNDEATAAAAQSVSAFEALGNKYQIALSRIECGLGLLKSGNPNAAREALRLAEDSFESLGASADLSKVRALLPDCDVEVRRPASTSSFSITGAERLLNAVVARDLLLHELVSVIGSIFDVNRAAVVEVASNAAPAVIASHSWDINDICNLVVSRQHLSHSTARSISSFWLDSEGDETQERTILLVDPVTGQNREQINLLVRIVQQGMELCALRKVHTPKLIETATTGNDLANSVGLLIGSVAMRHLLEAIHRIRSSDVTVLITGESGTGKELVARAVHAESARRDKAFVPFNCTTATRELADSLLFGHRRGAFTGASEDRQGVVRASDRGTLFLDEIGDLALEVQPKLLRFLQEGEVQPLGLERPIKVDVRVVAATNAELENLVEQGRFREDLFHRLNVIRLRVPSLRERREEVPMLARHFLTRFAQENQKRLALSAEATDLLQVFDWPGNVRQLSNEMRRVVAMAENGATITHEHLSPEIVGPSLVKIRSGAHSEGEVRGGVVIDVRQPMNDAVSQLEREMLLGALRQNKGNITKTARQLGLTRRGLHLKRERLGIQDFDADAK